MTTNTRYECTVQATFTANTRSKLSSSKIPALLIRMTNKFWCDHFACWTSHANRRILTTCDCLTASTAVVCLNNAIEIDKCIDRIGANHIEHVFTNYARYGWMRKEGTSKTIRRTSAWLQNTNLHGRKIQNTICDAHGYCWLTEHYPPPSKSRPT